MALPTLKWRRSCVAASNDGAVPGRDKRTLIVVAISVLFLGG
jgi:hypothetical protein